MAGRFAGCGRRVIAYDNRGSSATSVTPGPYTTAQMAADAVGLLDHLSLDRADVFGMSMGGMIAQELAITHPERVDRLVLGCTHAGLAHAAPTRAPVEERDKATKFARPRYSHCEQRGGGGGGDAAQSATVRLR